MITVMNINTRDRREQLRLLSKKALLKLLGYNNLKSYAKDKGETGKVSRKQLASVVLRNNLDI